MVANLRCGAWYVPRPDASCYFKSMDGHAGRWALSLTRLNWHLAALAAVRGGAFVVDATRRGKTFPVISCFCLGEGTWNDADIRDIKWRMAARAHVLRPC